MDGGRWLEAFRSLRSLLPPFLFFFFFFSSRQFHPCESYQTRFSTFRPSNFHPSPLLPSKKTISPIPKIILSIYLIDIRWEEEEEEEERVETSSIRWKKRRIDTNVFSGGSGG